jgi:hypothetical protein
MSKVIFLDFDGVININPVRLIINNKKMKLLNKIIQNTDAKIVLSTAHRYSPWSLTQFKIACKKLGWKTDKVIGRTADFESRKDFISYEDTRSKEIKSYLENHKEITHWVAIDDMKLELDNFVHIRRYTDGLTNEYVKQAISILNK